MADLSDITAYLAQTAANACYPNGTSQPSVAGIDVIVFEGWPLSETLDLDLTGQQLGLNGTVVKRPGGVRANVSIFPMQGTNTPIYQILDETYVITPAVYGLAATIVQGYGVPTWTIALTGAPGPSEFLTIELDNAYIASAGGADIAAILGALAAQINAFPNLANPAALGYAATISGNSMTITGLGLGQCAYCIARLGAQATLGRVIKRQRQSIMISVWAPDHESRSKIAAAIDILIKKHIVVTMPDTSMALFCYNRTNLTDEHEPVACYRRDLIVLADYATLDLFPGTVITSLTTTLAPLDPVNQNYFVTKVVG
jgi:hypothetical protein